MAGDHVGFHGPLKVLGVLNRRVLGVSENFLTLKEKKKIVRFLSFKTFIYFYLAVPGLSCGMQNLQLQHVGSSCQIQAPCIGSVDS